MNLLRDTPRLLRMSSIIETRSDGIEMANLQIKGIDDELYNEIKKLAAAEKRSVSQQILFLARKDKAHREFR